MLAGLLKFNHSILFVLTSYQVASSHDPARATSSTSRSAPISALAPCATSTSLFFFYFHFVDNSFESSLTFFNLSYKNRVIYPHSYADMLASGRTDAELMQILRAVHLEYIPGREGGWETKKEWKDVFSGGEKQRVGIGIGVGGDEDGMWACAIGRFFVSGYFDSNLVPFYPYLDRYG